MSHSHAIAIKESPLQPEHEMVFLLSQFRNVNLNRISELLKLKLNWAEILGYLAFHRMAGLAYTILNKFDYKMQNGQAMFTMMMVNNAQAVRTENNRKYLKAIEEILTQENIPHAFLKGSILANTLYPHGGRASNDIDILINPRDITKCGDCLEKLGFQQGFYDYKKEEITKLDRREIILRRMNWGEIVPYNRITNDPGMKFVEVDVNFSIDWLPVGTENIVEMFLKNAEQYKIGESFTISSLDKETFLIHLCMHLYKEAILYDMVSKLRDLDLYKYIDIYAYITDIDVNWLKLVNIINEYKLQSGCYFALEYVRQFFPSLNENKEFIYILNEIKPSNTNYLKEVIEPSKPDVKYLWNETLSNRFFDMKRYEKLVEVTI